MKTYKLYFSALMLALLTMLYSCDDDLYQVNHIGSELAENGDWRLSSFVLDDDIWEIPDNVKYLDIKLISHSDNSELQFEADCEHTDDGHKITIKIPEDSGIPDSDYDILGFLKNGQQLGHCITATFRDEMFHGIVSVAVSYPFTGQGTSASPYLITSADNFLSLLASLKLDSKSHAAGIYFKQTADFDAPAVSDAVQNRYYRGQAFAGHYDGNGKKIKLTFNGDGSSELDDYVGLFTQLLNGASVSNLTLDANLDEIRSKGGALAGYASGTVTVTNVNVMGNINGGSEIGGLIGSAKGKLTVNGCKLYCSIKGADYVGGIVGRAQNATLSISGVSNIKPNATEPETFKVIAHEGRAGGIVAMAEKCTLTLKDITLKYGVSKEAESIKVIYAPKGAGGLVGEALVTGKSQIANCTMAGTVRSESDYAGGLIGKAQLQDNLTVTNNSVNAPIIGKKYVGGLFGYVTGNNHLAFSADSETASSNTIAQLSNGHVAVRGTDCVGGLIGYLEGNFKASGLHHVSVNVTANGCSGGGVIGHLKDCNMNTKYFVLTNTVHVAGSEAIGGLVGRAENCTFTGEVKSVSFTNGIPKADTFKSSFPGIVEYDSKIHKGVNMGGIVGYATETSLHNLCCSGSVTGSSCVGGLIGYLHNRSQDNISHCVSRMECVENPYGDETGGLVGKAETGETVLQYLINYTKVRGGNHTGGVIGHLRRMGIESGITMDYAVNVGDVSGTKNVGGVIAYLDHMKDCQRGAEIRVTDCANYGTISNTDAGNIGGIMGHGNCARLTVMYCANHGKVEGGTRPSKVGGIVGRIGYDPATFYESENMELAYCCNRGTVSSGSKGSHVGGVAGYQEEGHQSDDTHWMTHDCYNTGDIPSDLNADTGGVLGCIDHYGEIVRCINIGEVSHGNGVLGTHPDSRIFYHHNLYHLEGTGKGWKSKAFSESDKKNSAKFKNFDFNSVWEIDQNDKKNGGYPCLRKCPFQSVYITKM